MSILKLQDLSWLELINWSLTCMLYVVNIGHNVHFMKYDKEHEYVTAVYQIRDLFWNNVDGIDGIN